MLVYACDLEINSLLLYHHLCGCCVQKGGGGPGGGGGGYIRTQCLLSWRGYGDE